MVKDTKPSHADNNGQGKDGRFLPGNKCGTGNPHLKKVRQLRSALLKAVTGKDLREIIKALVEKAKAGDVLAAREIFDRALGKSKQSIDIDQAGGGMGFAVYMGSEIVKPPSEEGEKQE